MSKEKYYVGRKAEIEQFAMLIESNTPYQHLNIFGPGGIGKTVVGQKMKAYAHTHNIPIALVDGFRQDLTPIKILRAIQLDFATDSNLVESLSPFANQYAHYELIQEFIQIGGGINNLYTSIGIPEKPETLEMIWASFDTTIPTTVRQIVTNRFALERYLRSIESTLTATFKDGLTVATLQTQQSVTIILDTYEQLEGYDDWICRQLISDLHKSVKVIFLGRNALPRINFEWVELGERLYSMDLPELSAIAAKQYLRHFGLTDSRALQKVYELTGGYPLLLVLIVHLAREADGWHNVDALTREAERDRMATQLLNRILREERVEPVRSFLEKGIVARWFTPEIVSEILEVNMLDGRKVYDQLHRHSFVEQHPLGLKFHDKIRDLLMARLRFTDSAEFDRISQLLQRYYARKAGLDLETGEPRIVDSAKILSPAIRFGKRLKFFRIRAIDPKTEKPLTQATFSEQISAEPKVPQIDNTTISKWENGHAIISISDRHTLLAIVRVLHRTNGIQTLEEANELLQAGDYRNLNRSEQKDIFTK